MDRKQLIEAAAKAMADASPDGGWNRLNDYERGWYRRDAGAAFAVFEGAYTPSDDERARMVAFFRRMVPIIHEPLATQVAEEWVDMFLKEFGFRRTVQGEPSVPPRPTEDEFSSLPVADLNAFRPQGEPSDAALDAACHAFGHHPWGTDPRGAMRAALRAAAETGGEPDGR